MLGYLGPAGTFSHSAATEWAKGKNYTLVPFKTIQSLIKAVDGGKINAGIVPIENSIDGGINVTLDTLAFGAEIYITGEYVLNISQNLMVKKGYNKENIRQIASISPAIGQCRTILSDEFENTPIKYTNSTAEAAEFAAASDGSIACIAAQKAAEIYGLDIICPDCGDEHNNSTRFIIIEKERSRAVTQHDKTSIAFTLENTPGSLYNALKTFADAKLNMTKIESRPIPEQPFEYRFFVDFEGNLADAAVENAILGIKEEAARLKILGNY